MTPSRIHTLSRAIIVQNDYFLLCKNPKASTAYLYLPGGHIEEGESARYALKREMQEETSLNFSVRDFLGVFEYQFFPKDPHLACHTHEYNFLFSATCTDLVAPTLPPEPEKESVQFIWVHIKDFSAHTIYPEGIQRLFPNLKQHAKENDYFFSKMK